MIRLQFLLSEVIDTKHAIQGITDWYGITISHAVEADLVFLVWIVGGVLIDFLQ